MVFVRNDICDLEIDDRIFPWHFDDDLKQLIFHIARTPNIEATIREFVNYAKNEPNHFIHKYVQAECMEDFVTECPKYCKGVRLGFLDISMKVPM
jgi:hypothetical protein